MWVPDEFLTLGWQTNEKQIRRQLGFIIRYGKKRKYRQKEIDNRFISYVLLSLIEANTYNSAP